MCPSGFNTSPCFLGDPESVTIVGGGHRRTLPAAETLWLDDIVVEMKAHDGQEIFVTANDTPVAFLALRWRVDTPTGALYLGDAWERSYGDLQWRPLAPSRLMPWYFFALETDSRTGRFARQTRSCRPRLRRR